MNYLRCSTAFKAVALTNENKNPRTYLAAVDL